MSFQQINANSQPILSQALRDTILGRLRADDQVEADQIQVSVENGAVTLTGTAKGRWSKMRAEDIVSRIEGVRAINNLLRTEHEPRTPDGHVAEGGTDAPSKARK